MDRIFQFASFHQVANIHPRLRRSPATMGTTYIRICIYQRNAAAATDAAAAYTNIQAGLDSQPLTRMHMDARMLTRHASLLIWAEFRLSLRVCP